MEVDTSYSLFNNQNQINSYQFYSSMVDYSNIVSNSQAASDLLTRNKSSIYDNYINTDYLDQFRSNLSNLEDETETLILDQTDSVFQQRVASSSDSNILTTNAEAGATKAEYEVQVNQLAEAQLNESSSFDSDAANNFTLGDNTISISQGGATKELTVNINSFDTNSDVLYKLEEKINDSELNIRSDVVNNDDGTSYLEIESTKAGTSDTFSISDVSGDLVARTEIDNTTNTAQDADYDVDGENYISTSNQVEITEEVNLSLNEVGDATVTVNQDKDALNQAAEGFVDQFNETIDFLRSSGNNNSFELAEELVQINEREENDLESIGIDVSIDGTLSLNKEEFKQSIDENYQQVESVLGSSVGVATEVNDKVENTLSEPISQFSEMDQFSFYDQSGQSSFPFQSMYVGALFDSYF